MGAPESFRCSDVGANLYGRRGRGVGENEGKVDPGQQIADGREGGGAVTGDRREQGGSGHRRGGRARPDTVPDADTGAVIMILAVRVVAVGILPTMIVTAVGPVIMVSPGIDSLGGMPGNAEPRMVGAVRNPE